MGSPLSDTTAAGKFESSAAAFTSNSRAIPRMRVVVTALNAVRFGSFSPALNVVRFGLFPAECLFGCFKAFSLE